MILGLHGRLQAGKDTAYARIAELVIGTKVERLSFADPLKDSAAALLGVTREELEYLKLRPEKTITVRVPLSDHPYESRYRTVALSGREYLQRYGTESHRGVFGDDFWVEQALAKVIDPDVVYVVTDVRFPNEAAAIVELNGVVVHVIGPQGKASGNHQSEAPLPDDLIDFEIDNTRRDDDFASLDEHLVTVLKTLGIRAEVFVA